MTVMNVNTACSRHYAEGKIFIRLPGGISDEKYSFKGFGRFGKNNKAHRRGIQQNTYRREIHRRADLYPRRHYRNALSYNERESAKRGTYSCGTPAGDYGGG